MGVPRVDFYVLASQDPGARLRFACRLVEKAWLRRHRVRVQLEPGGELATFDDLLWVFSENSFVPHRRLGETEPQGAPASVVIADSADADPGDGDLVVNLGRSTPPRVESFARIAEVVDGDQRVRQRGRERFRWYREHGFEPGTHEMGDPS